MDTDTTVGRLPVSTLSDSFPLFVNLNLSVVVKGGSRGLGVLSNRDAVPSAMGRFQIYVGQLYAPVIFAKVEGRRQVMVNQQSATTILCPVGFD